MLAVEEVEPCNYILVGTPILASPFYPEDREFPDRGLALDFMAKVFDLGRRLRRKRYEKRESARHMIYDWDMDCFVSGGLATYGIVHFNLGQYDACVLVVATDYYLPKMIKSSMEP